MPHRSDDQHLCKIDRRFWRMKFSHDAGDILGPARSAEGRFHFDGQPALYLSETPEGCIVASQRYMRPDDPPRAIYSLHVRPDRIIDLRDPAACTHWQVGVTHRAAEWQRDRARALRPPTWDISDRIRAAGLDGMLYASRSQPALTHLTLFRWNTPKTAQVRQDGAPVPFP